MSLSLQDAAKLGGSDLAGLLGLSRWQTPLGIYARVVAALEGRALPSNDDGPKRRGRHLEHAVLRLYAEETGARILGGYKFVHPRIPYGRASLDALVERAGRRVAEVKTAGLSELRHWGEAGTDEVPRSYILQTCWYGGVALAAGAVDTAEVDIAALVAGDLRVYPVPHDAELFAMLEAALERFWVDHVLPRHPPPVTEPLRDVDAAGALYPRHAGTERHWDTLGTEEQRAVRDYLKARARLRRAEMRAAGCEAVLKLALKETPKVFGLPASTGAKALTWKKNKDGAETHWMAVAERLRSEMHVSPTQYASIVGDNTKPKEGARPLRVTAAREDE